MPFLIIVLWLLETSLWNKQNSFGKCSSRLFWNSLHLLYIYTVLKEEIDVVDSMFRLGMYHCPRLSYAFFLIMQHRS